MEPGILTEQQDEHDAAASDEEHSAQERNRYEMDVGAKIRFKVKSINFTQVTNTAKGVQARTTTTSHSISAPSLERALSVGSASEMMENPVRRRSSSVDISENSKVPASMHITASICEDGLGLTSWWAAPEEDEEEADDDG
jgi:DNA-directed RNA polymerase III subunit RPC8